MSQICPDCKEEHSDSSNYCSSCQAKLPNASPCIPDPKKAANFLCNSKGFDSKKFATYLKNPELKVRVFSRILCRMVKNENFDFPHEAYFREQILTLILEEMVDMPERIKQSVASEK
jgi:hypothetical protein